MTAPTLTREAVVETLAPTVLVPPSGLSVPEAATGQALVPTPAWKRAIDLFGAASGLLLLAPLIALIAVAVVVDSRGGPFHRQHRVGRGGSLFRCWKFRSMVRNAAELQAVLSDRNEANGLIFKMKDDPRRTRVGRFLRRTSLDELPQLWNVLRGEMSLVGPRPPLPAEVALYRPEHFERLAVTPGMTGLWQVTLRGRHDFADMVALDLEYARRLSFWLDLRILLRTAGTVVRGTGSC
ncbi:MAG: sugar transferase [Dehalococcoidia bacterium]|nr:sugar transferase [Dehalococcoidia bacterium]